MKSKKKILWILGPEEYLNSGIGKYSKYYISYLNKFFDIDEEIIYIKAKSLKRYIYQFLFLPFKLLLISSKYEKVVVYEESLLYLALFIRSTKLIIIHDSRLFLNEEARTLIEKIKSKLFKFYKKFVNKYDYIVVPSNFTKKELNKYNISNKIEVIYNPIEFYNNDIDDDILKKYNINNIKNKTILLYVGSEESRKNFMTLLKLVKKHKDKYILIKIGKPIVSKNRQLHLKYIKDNNIESCIFFIENLSEKELASFYRKAHVFVFPSLFEGFGRPPVEAQYHGLPVVSTKKGALEEILKDSCLYVSNPYSVEEWDYKISLLITNDKLRKEIIEKGFNNAKRFTISRLGKKFKILLEK